MSTELYQSGEGAKALAKIEVVVGGLRFRPKRVTGPGSGGWCWVVWECGSWHTAMSRPDEFSDWYDASLPEPILLSVIRDHLRAWLLARRVWLQPTTADKVLWMAYLERGAECECLCDDGRWHPDIGDSDPHWFDSEDEALIAAVLAAKESK